MQWIDEYCAKNDNASINNSQEKRVQHYTIKC